MADDISQDSNEIPLIHKKQTDGATPQSVLDMYTSSMSTFTKNLIDGFKQYTDSSNTESSLKKLSEEIVKNRNTAPRRQTFTPMRSASKAYLANTPIESASRKKATNDILGSLSSINNSLGQLNNQKPSVVTPKAKVTTSTKPNVVTPKAKVTTSTKTKSDNDSILTALVSINTVLGKIHTLSTKQLTAINKGNNLKSPKKPRTNTKPKPGEPQSTAIVPLGNRNIVPLGNRELDAYTQFTLQDYPKLQSIPKPEDSRPRTDRLLDQDKSLASNAYMDAWMNQLNEYNPYANILPSANSPLFLEDLAEKPTPNKAEIKTNTARTSSTQNKVSTVKIESLLSKIHKQVQSIPGLLGRTYKLISHIDKGLTPKSLKDYTKLTPQGLDTKLNKILDSVDAGDTKGDGFIIKRDYKDILTQVETDIEDLGKSISKSNYSDESKSPDFSNIMDKFDKSLNAKLIDHGKAPTPKPNWLHGEGTLLNNMTSDSGISDTMWDLQSSVDASGSKKPKPKSFEDILVKTLVRQDPKVIGKMGLIGAGFAMITTAILNDKGKGSSDKEAPSDGLIGGIVGFGTALLGGLTKSIPQLLSKAIPKIAKFNLTAGLIWAAVDGVLGFLEKDAWEVSGAAAVLGGALAGTGSGEGNALKNAGKGGLIGSGIGGAAGGPLGLIAGGLIGAVIGGVLGYLGGERVATDIQDIIDRATGAIHVMDIVGDDSLTLSDKIGSVLGNVSGILVGSIFVIFDKIKDGVADAVKDVSLTDLLNPMSEFNQNFRDMFYGTMAEVRGIAPEDQRGTKEYYDKLEAEYKAQEEERKNRDSSPIVESFVSFFTKDKKEAPTAPQKKTESNAVDTTTKNLTSSKSTSSNLISSNYGERYKGTPSVENNVTGSGNTYNVYTPPNTRLYNNLKL